MFPKKYEKKIYIKTKYLYHVRVDTTWWILLVLKKLKNIRKRNGEKKEEKKDDRKRSGNKIQSCANKSTEVLCNLQNTHRMEGMNK